MIKKPVLSEAKSKQVAAKKPSKQSKIPALLEKDGRFRCVVWNDGLDEMTSPPDYRSLHFRYINRLKSGHNHYLRIFPHLLETSIQNILTFC